jgi:hypothetical protein
VADWGLAVSVLAAAVGLGVLIQRVLAQLSAQIDSRFAEAEARRREAMEIWSERLHARDGLIESQARRLEAAAAEHREIHARIDGIEAVLNMRYVTRETFIEEAGRNLVKLDKILDRLNQLDPHHG